MLLFDGGDAPLATFGPKLSAKAAKALQDSVSNCTCTPSSPTFDAAG